MEDADRGESFAALNEGAAWTALERALSAYVAGMTGSDDHLDLEAPGEVSVCLGATEFGRVRMQVPALDSQKTWAVDQADEVAAAAVSTLRHELHVAHPHLLTVSAFGPQAALRGMLGLQDSEDVPHEPGGREPPPVVVPSDRAELNALIEESLKARFGEDPATDDDGDFVLTHLGQPVWVHAFEEQPAVRVMARVAHGVRSRRQTAVELSILNRDSVFITWVLRDRDVWQQATLSALPFAASHLDEALAQFFNAMSHTRDDLALQLGAGVA
jgi:hypothetical protein